VSVAQGGTGAAMTCSSGQVPIAQSSTALQCESVSGDGTVSSSGVLDVSSCDNGAISCSGGNITSTNATFVVGNADNAIYFYNSTPEIDFYSGSSGNWAFGPSGGGTYGGGVMTVYLKDGTAPTGACSNGTCQTSVGGSWITTDGSGNQITLGNQEIVFYNTAGSIAAQGGTQATYGVASLTPYASLTADQELSQANVTVASTGTTSLSASQCGHPALVIGTVTLGTGGAVLSFGSCPLNSHYIVDVTAVTPASGKAFEFTYGSSNSTSANTSGWTANGGLVDVYINAAGNIRTTAW
jgi:hypothetical protein